MVLAASPTEAVVDSEVQRAPALSCWRSRQPIHLPRQRCVRGRADCCPTALPHVCRRETQRMRSELHWRTSRPSVCGGRVVGLNGSINLYLRPDGNVLVGVKLGVSDNPSASQPQFVRPARVVLIEGYRTNASEIILSAPSEDEGFLLVGYDLLGGVTSEIIITSTTSGTIRIGYAREGGRSDAQFVVDVSTGSDLRRDPEAVQAWRDCVSAVLQAASGEADR